MHAAKLAQSASVVMLVQEGNADLALTCHAGRTAHQYAVRRPLR